MAKRERAVIQKDNYFTGDKAGLQFFSTGCTLLDCALGGGLVLGRISNLVGDRSTAKTALATEAIINFLRQYPNGSAAYRESEAAFDRGYAEAMGMPIDRVDFGDEAPLATVEDFARDLFAFVAKQKKSGEPGIYVLDSLDALSDEAEMEADISKGTYGMAKAKQLSIMFRKMTRSIEDSKVHLLVVSQVRDNINPMAFGEKSKRSGGKALDFYASQVTWLAHIKTLKRTIKGIERPYGIEVRAKIKKNKVALAFRECDFPFYFGYGVEDLQASLEWLKSIKRLDALDLSESGFKAYKEKLEDLSDKEYRDEQADIAKIVKKVWKEIDNTFLPKRQKYG